MREEYYTTGDSDLVDILEITQLVDIGGVRSWFIFYRVKVESDLLRKCVSL